MAEIETRENPEIIPFIPPSKKYTTYIDGKPMGRGDTKDEARLAAQIEYERKRDQEYKRESESSDDSSSWNNTSISKPSKYGKYITICFWGVIALFWCWAFYLSFRYDNETARYIITKSLSSLWSPTKDPVLNFIIDVVLIVAGIAMGIGIISSGMLILIVLLCIAIAFLVFGVLVAIAKVSITGTIVASIIGMAILYYGSKYLSQKFFRKV